MKLCVVIVILITTWISTISTWPMGAGITELVENKCGYNFKQWYWIELYLEIGFSLFDSYVIVNAYIAWKNHILKGKPKAHHVRRKYQIRQVRLKLIHRWTKRCSRHYEATQPHRQKRLRTVNTFLKEPHFVSHYKARAKPVKPGSAYHDEPVKIPMGKGTCVICKKRTRWHCFGCCKELEGIYPVCSPSVRNCNELHHRARNEI